APNLTLSLHDALPIFKGHYSADVSRRINFAFRVRRNPGRIILFVTQGQAQSSGREDSWSSYEYGYVCGESEETRDSQAAKTPARSEEHTSELQSRFDL